MVISPQPPQSVSPATTPTAPALLDAAPAPTSSPPGLAPTAAGGRGRACRCLKTSGHLATIKGSTGTGRRDQRQRKVKDPKEGGGGSALVTLGRAVTAGALKAEQLWQHERSLRAREPTKRSHRNGPSRGHGRVVSHRTEGVGATPLGRVTRGFSGRIPAARS